ncbi:MAG TPA: hypothetical protein VNZ57_10205, partial [Longimicrobiales bacterium]|nr:hypothetical protein [Longimicrobiales bacterium]
MRGLLAFTTAWVMAGILLVAGCGADQHAGLGPDVRRELVAGREYADRLAESGRRSVDVDAELAVAIGYLERHRIGLGGPFRLLDQVLTDPRLGEGTRSRLAWALLALTVDGAGYQVDPAALDRMGPAGLENVPGAGRHHLELIEVAIAE